MREKKKPEKKKLSAKTIKMTIIAMEKRRDELKKAIEETKNPFTKSAYKDELRLIETWLEQFKRDPNGTSFDEFEPLYETPSK